MDVKNQGNKNIINKNWKEQGKEKLNIKKLKYTFVRLKKLMVILFPKTHKPIFHC